MTFVLINCVVVCIEPNLSALWRPVECVKKKGRNSEAGKKKKEKEERKNKRKNLRLERIFNRSG
jgi:hypothetical protein